jgi:hypothetical protein
MTRTEIATRQRFLRLACGIAGAGVLSACGTNGTTDFLSSIARPVSQSVIPNNLCEQNCTGGGGGNTYSTYVNGDLFQLLDSKRAAVYQMQYDPTSTNVTMSEPSSTLATVNYVTPQVGSSFAVSGYGTFQCPSDTEVIAPDGYVFSVNLQTSVLTITAPNGQTASATLPVGTIIDVVKRSLQLSPEIAKACLWAVGDLAIATVGTVLACLAIEVPVIGEIGMAVAAVSWVSAAAHAGLDCRG